MTIRFCQRDLCQQVLDAGGDYLVIVKANQPRLLEALQLLFDPGWDVPLLDRRETRTVDKGHGRAGEVRHLIASTDLEGYVDSDAQYPAPSPSPIYHGASVVGTIRSLPQKSAALTRPG